MGIEVNDKLFSVGDNEDAHYMRRKLAEEYLWWGLQMNFEKKTEYML